MTANDTLSITKIIPTEVIAAVELKVSKLNKRAIRNGFDVVELEIGNEVIYTYHFATQFGCGEFKNKADYVNSPLANKWVVENKEVTCYTAKHGFNGYRMVGVTENVEGIHTLNVFEDKFDLSKERGTCACDHCNVTRNRNKVFFVADEDDNIKRLGSSCVSLFFEGNVNALEYFDIENTVHGVFDEFEAYDYSSKTAKQFDVNVILKWALWVSQNIGYVSVSNSKETGKNSTSDTVQYYLNGLMEKDDTPSREEVDVYQNKANDLINWAVSKKGESDYFNTVNEIIEAGYTPSKLVGYIVGILGWKRSEEAREEVSNSSNWIGDTGSKTTLSGVVKRVHSYQNAFGVGYITTLDCNGDIVTYFNQFKVRGKDVYASEGDNVDCVATVKEHTTFNNVKQTVISRPSKIKIGE